MGESFRADPIVYLRPNRLLAALPFGVVAGPVLFTIGVTAKMTLLAGLSPLVSLLALLGIASGRLANRWPARITGELVAGEEGVFLDGKRLATRGEIKGGLVVPQGLGPPMVRLLRGIRRPIDLVVEDDAEGRALLLALGLDASQTVVTFRTPSRLLTDRGYRISLTFAVMVLAVLGGLLVRDAGRNGGSPLGAMVRLGLVATLVSLSTLTRARIDVGADGVLTSWLGLQKRFLPYREITSVASYIDDSGSSRYRYRGVLLTTTDGETVQVPVTQLTAIDSSNRVNAVLARIREAMATYQRGEATASAATLDRGDRTERDWIRALRAVGSGAAADHRTAPVLPEQLWRIVEDPSQSPELRAGAAVVLGGSIDEERRARLRVAAGAVAEPRVRMAIEAAGSDDEEALAQALAELPREARTPAT